MLSGLHLEGLELTVGEATPEPFSRAKGVALEPEVAEGDLGDQQGEGEAGDLGHGPLAPETKGPTVEDDGADQGLGQVGGEGHAAQGGQGGQNPLEPAEVAEGRNDGHKVPAGHAGGGDFGQVGKRLHDKPGFAEVELRGVGNGGFHHEAEDEQDGRKDGKEAPLGLFGEQTALPEADADEEGREGVRDDAGHQGKAVVGPRGNPGSSGFRPRTGTEGLLPGREGSLIPGHDRLGVEEGGKVDGVGGDGDMDSHQGEGHGEHGANAKAKAQDEGGKDANQGVEGQDIATPEQHGMGHAEQQKGNLAA